MARYGTVELGGTKISVAAGTGPQDLEGPVTFPTTDPVETLDTVVGHLEGWGVEAVGVASFGPVELRPGRPAWGHIATTPKPGWSHADVAGLIRRSLGVPVGFDTDVNGAGLGEGRWGAGRGLASFVYVTVGTGIGGGAIIDGKPRHGLVHPEMGHIPVRGHPDDDFAGMCRFHGACLEGLAGGPALQARWGRRGEELSGPEAERAMELEAFYLGQLVRALVYVLAPDRVILGGGVGGMAGLHEEVQRRLVEELAGYPGLPEHEEGFVVPPGLGKLAGLAGGLVLAERAGRGAR